MSEHSPGPWTTGQGMPDAIIAADGSLVCRLSSVDYRTGKQIKRSTAEDLANARVIAAALDLLEACKRYVRQYRASHGDEIKGETPRIIFAAVVKAEQDG